MAKRWYVRPAAALVFVECVSVVHHRYRAITPEQAVAYGMSAREAARYGRIKADLTSKLRRRVKENRN